MRRSLLSQSSRTSRASCIHVPGARYSDGTSVVTSGVMAALYAAGHQEVNVRNLILMATPFDFSQMGAMVALLREGRLDPDELLDETGNVPADALYSGFYMLAPTSDVAQKATLLENLWNDEFVEGFQAMATRSKVAGSAPAAGISSGLPVSSSTASSVARLLASSPAPRGVTIRSAATP